MRGAWNGTREEAFTGADREPDRSLESAEMSSTMNLDRSTGDDDEQIHFHAVPLGVVRPRDHASSRAATGTSFAGQPCCANPGDCFLSG